MLARVSGDEAWDDVTFVHGGLGSAQLELLRHRAEAPILHSANTTPCRPGTIAVALRGSQQPGTISSAPGTLDGHLAAPRSPSQLARWPEEHSRHSAPSPRAWRPPYDMQVSSRHGPSSPPILKGFGAKSEWATARALVRRTTNSLSTCLGVMALQFTFVAWRGFCQEAGGANELDSSQFLAQDMMYAWSRRAARALVLAERRRPAQLRLIVLVWKGLVSESKLAVVNQRLCQMQKRARRIVAKEPASLQSLASLVLQLWHGFAEISGKVRHLASRESCVRMHALDVIITRKHRTFVLRALFAWRLHAAELWAERHPESRARLDTGLESAQALEIAELQKTVRQAEDQLQASRRAEAEAVHRVLEQEMVLEESREIVDESRGIVFAQQRERQDFEDIISRLSGELHDFHTAHEASALALGDVQALLWEAERAGGHLLDLRSSQSSDPQSCAVATELDRLRGAQLQVDALRQELHRSHPLENVVPEVWDRELLRQRVQTPPHQPVVEEDRSYRLQHRLRCESMKSVFEVWCRWSCVSRRDRRIEQLQVFIGQVGLRALSSLAKVVSRHTLFRDSAQLRLVIARWRVMLLTTRNAIMVRRVAEQTQHVQQLQQHGAVSSFGALCTVGRFTGQLEFLVMRAALLVWRDEVLTLQKSWLGEQLVISGSLVQQSELRVRSWGVSALHVVDRLAIRSLTHQFLHAWRVETLSALEERLRCTTSQFRDYAVRTLRMVVSSLNSALIRGALRAWMSRTLSTSNYGFDARSECGVSSLAIFASWRALSGRTHSGHRLERVCSWVCSLLDRLQERSLSGVVLAHWWGMVCANFSERLREELIHSNLARQKHVSGMLLDLALCCSSALMKVVTIAWQYDAKRAHVHRAVSYFRDNEHRSIASIVLHAMAAQHSVIAHAILAAWQNAVEFEFRAARAFNGAAALQQKVPCADAGIRGAIFSAGSYWDRQHGIRLLQVLLACWREIILGIWNERIGARLAEQSEYLEHLQRHSFAIGQSSRCTICRLVDGVDSLNLKVALMSWHSSASVMRSRTSLGADTALTNQNESTTTRLVAILQVQALRAAAAGTRSRERTLLGSVFSAWRVRGGKSCAERRVDHFLVSTLHLLSKRDVARMRVIVSNWRGATYACRSERLRKQLWQSRCDGRARLVAAISGALGARGLQRARLALVIWHLEARLSRSHPAASSEHARWRGRVRRAMARLAGGHVAILVRSSFAAWHASSAQEQGGEAWMEAMKGMVADLQQENEELINTLVEQPRQLAAALRDAARSGDDLEDIRDRFLGVAP